MKILEERILRDGVVRDSNVLKVDSFINHQIDVDFMAQIAKEFKRIFEGEEITKILTIEASGISIACITALEFHVPVVFAKKNKTINIANDVYTAKVSSFTHKRSYDVIVSKDFLRPEDKILIIDDFLAMGAALKGLVDLIRLSGATLVGAGVVIEKAYQPGGRLIRGMGVRVESLAKIKSMDNNEITFC